MDLPGAGRYHEKSAIMSVKKAARFLHEQHKDSLAAHAGNNVLLATSLGGMLALEWLNEHPKAFDATIMLSTSFKGISKGKERAQPKAKWAMLGILLTGDMPQREAKLLEINSNLRANDQELLDRWIEIQRKRPITRWTMIKQGLGGLFFRASKRRVEVPVLLLGSTADKMVAESCIYKVQDWLSASTYMHEKSGHGIPIDAPLWVVDKTSDWWQQLLDERVSNPL